MKNSVILILISLVLFTYCSSSPPIHKYVLTPSIENNAVTNSSNSGKEITLAIGSVEFAEYLMRPEMINFIRSNELSIDQFNRWAEPLDENFKRVLIENLSNLIPTDKIYFFPIQKENPNRFLVSISVNEFGMRTDSSVVLDARWNVSKKFKKDYLMTRKSFYSEKASGFSIERRVALLSELIGKLSRDIANEIKKDIE
jgi:uncharacterized protein